MVLVNEEARLCSEVAMPFWPVAQSISVVGSFSGVESSQLVLPHLSGLVSALEYVVEHNRAEFLLPGLLKSGAVTCSVHLIGRNEVGHTLPASVIDLACAYLHMIFDYSTPLGNMNDHRSLALVQTVATLTIADANHSQVLNSKTILEDLVEGLMLAEDNPRRGTAMVDKFQLAAAQVLENLALSEENKKPLTLHSGVMDGLRLLQKNALSEEARRSATAALFELDKTTRQKAKDVAATMKAAASKASEDCGETSIKHIMLSYNWDHQEQIKRINLALNERDYSVWIDIEKMQGSTVEAMSAAVEDAAVMCYGISQAYKESANCRLEAQYAYQQKLDMVPLMMEEGYSANGWLGMLLGVRLWYGFYGTVLRTDNAFEGKMNELCREIGERGKA